MTAITIIASILALGLGFGLGLLFLKARLDVARARLADTQSALDRERQSFADIKTMFKGLSSEVLKENSEQFIKQATPTIAEHVRPLEEALRRYDVALRSIEERRNEAYGGLKKQIDMLQGYTQQLKDETGSLKNALKSSTARGRWGEVTLRRVVELAGMSAHCDFSEQVTATAEDCRMRPDMIVKLPGGKSVVVDAKAPLDAYLRAAEAASDHDRARHLAEHARAVRDHMKRLGLKSYWEQFDSSTDFVVMFLPGESFAAAALEADRTLFEDGLKSSVRVILATPATLIALLRSFAMGWQQELLAENAQRISDAGKDLFERCSTFAGHLGNVGGGLDRAIKSFNAAVGSWESRVVPGARKLMELGATKSPDAELSAIDTIETAPRQVASPNI